MSTRDDAELTAALVAALVRGDAVFARAAMDLMSSPKAGLFIAASWWAEGIAAHAAARGPARADYCADGEDDHLEDVLAEWRASVIGG